MKKNILAFALCFIAVTMWAQTIYKTTGADGVSNTLIGYFAASADGTGLILATQPWVYNGTTHDMLRGDATNGMYVQVKTMPGSTATTTDTALRGTLISAASTNATNVKASAGNVYGFRFVNTTTTVYYLRMYNLATAPTCSSATGFVETIPIPPAGAAGGAAGIVAIEPMGEAYTTGIAFCFTGGSSSTDNTNAATGVFGSILYK